MAAFTANISFGFSGGGGSGSGTGSNTELAIYVSDGTEGFTITVPGLGDKVILLVIRSQVPMNPVDAAPDSSQVVYATNGLDGDFTFGTPMNDEVNETVLIIYRGL